MSSSGSCRAEFCNIHMPRCSSDLCGVGTSRFGSGPCSVDTSRWSAGLCSVDISGCNTGLCSVHKSGFHQRLDWQPSLFFNIVGKDNVWRVAVYTQTQTQTGCLEQRMPIVGLGVAGRHTPHPPAILPPPLPVYCLPDPPTRPRIVAACSRRLMIGGRTWLLTAFSCSQYSILSSSFLQPFI
jgi:hypothetical protein